jgi:2'-5' RNA ligase
VWPPADLVARLAALARPDVPGLRWTSAAQWHITLRFLGAVDDVDTVDQALSVVARRAAPVMARAGPATGQFGHRVLHLPVDGLAALAEGVVAATAGLGEPPGDRAFTGHLTLARVNGRVNIRPFGGRPLSAEWLVDELTLVESRLSSAEARYEVVGRYPLVGVAPN